LDEVEGLGQFMELEVVLEGGEPTEIGVKEAKRLMDDLGVSTAELIDYAYVDLLAKGGAA
jgi:adenylate cyclase class IV